MDHNEFLGPQGHGQVPPQPQQQPSFSRSSAVAVGNFHDGVTAIWTGVVLLLTGIYPLVTLLRTLDNPRFMNTLGDWLLVSVPMIVGLIILGFGVKEKGYQKNSIRIFGLISFFVGILLFSVTPTIASILYGTGSGN